MKLAEALLKRSEYQKKLAVIQGRILANLRVQDNEKPLEDPNLLLKEADELNGQICDLIKKINMRNNQSYLEEGRTLAEALADREAILSRRNLLAVIADEGSKRDYRLTRTELKTVITVDIAKIQKEVDKLSREFRELDTKIQQFNWNEEL